MGCQRFVTLLNSEQKQALEQLQRTGCSHRVRQRAHAVLLSAKRYTLDQIADVLDVDRDAVSRTLDRWEQGEVAALAEAPRPGRPPKVDAALEAEVFAVAREQPASVRRVLAKRGRCVSPALGHAEEMSASRARALAAQLSAHGQAAHTPPGHCRTQGAGQAARLRAGRALRSVLRRRERLLLAAHAGPLLAAARPHALGARASAWPPLERVRLSARRR